MVCAMPSIRKGAATDATPHIRVPTLFTVGAPLAFNSVQPRGLATGTVGSLGERRAAGTRLAPELWVGDEAARDSTIR